ncbi:Uncharacterised protein [Achromobacter xylosoxidans]|nr:Uncharacterised protein [Achromobacter xylosoxidans]
MSSRLSHSPSNSTASARTELSGTSPEIAKSIRAANSSASRARTPGNPAPFITSVASSRIWLNAINAACSGSSPAMSAWSRASSSSSSTISRLSSTAMGVAACCAAGLGGGTCTGTVPGRRTPARSTSSTLANNERTSSMSSRWSHSSNSSNASARTARRDRSPASAKSIRSEISSAWRPRSSGKSTPFTTSAASFRMLLSAARAARSASTLAISPWRFASPLGT